MNHKTDMAVLRVPGAITLLIFGICFLVGCPPLGLVLIFVAGMLLAKSAGTARELQEAERQKAHEKWDRERILAAKSLRD